MVLKKKFFISLIILFIFITIIYYLFFTTSGSYFVIKKILSHFLKTEQIKYTQSKGSFFQTLSLTDINIKNALKQYKISIQQLDAKLSIFLNKSYIEITNGTVRFPTHELIYFYGTLRKQNLDFHLYSKTIALNNISSIIPDVHIPETINGILINNSFFITGNYKNPKISGTVILKQLSYSEFKVQNCPITAKISIKHISTKPSLFGNITLDHGTIQRGRTSITLNKSKINFDGDIGNPSLYIKGVSIVDNVTINILLQGTLKQPDLRLTSTPSLPEERLLLMLATGKSWKDTETALSEGKITQNMSAELIDYFLFSGSMESIAKYFGIDSISFQSSKDSNEIAVGKKISKDLKLQYGVSQKKEKDDYTDTEQTAGVEYKITNKISAEGELGYKTSEGPNDISEESPLNGKILLKYKTQF